MMTPKKLNKNKLSFVDGYKRGYCEIVMKSPFIEGSSSDELFRRGWRLGRMDAHADGVQPLELMDLKDKKHGT